MAACLRVGVVIAAHDMAAWIGTCLCSLLNQTHAEWRVVVVDDGSRDGTAAVVACFRDPRIRLVRQPNAGVSAARNRGAEEAGGDAVLFLDADDWLAPDALARMAATLAANPDAAAVWGRFALMRDSAEPGHRPLRVVRPRLGRADALAALLVGNRFANGGHVLIRRAAAGRFDTMLGFGEDWEYWVRLALAGPLVPVPGTEPVLFVRRRETGAYRSRVCDLAAFAPATAAIFRNPAVQARFPARRLRRLRRAAQAEQAWIAGRAMLELDRPAGGLRLLRRSVRTHPTLRRTALLVAWHLGVLAQRVMAPGRVAAASAGVADPR